MVTVSLIWNKYSRTKLYASNLLIFEFDSDESDIESCETVKKSVVDNDFFDMEYFDSEIDV